MILRTALAVTLLAACAAVPAEAAPAVERAEYSLGDAAFYLDDFHDYDGKLQPMELTAVVHYPKKLGHKHPLIVLAHGLWQTCIARDGTPKQQNQWPCEPGTPPLPSYRGYDYLGRELASHGFVVVSISANGANAGEMGEKQDRARAMLMSKHLEMWRDLAVSGGGPLAGKLPVDFHGRVDLTNVGTMGHSRGGRGAVWQASDNHAQFLPAGVRIRAVVPLAPAQYYAPEPGAPQHLDYRITKIPFGAVTGACDDSVGGGPDYFDNAEDFNTEPIHLFNLHGANHNFYNTQWSPSSGQLFSHDDATHPSPGMCETYEPVGAEKQLTESGQRDVTADYLSAFYRRYLLGDKRFDSLLRDSRPGVDVRVDLPVQ